MSFCLKGNKDILNRAYLILTLFQNIEILISLILTLFLKIWSLSLFFSFIVLVFIEVFFVSSVVKQGLLNMNNMVSPFLKLIPKVEVFVRSAACAVMGVAS